MRILTSTVGSPSRPRLGLAITFFGSLAMVFLASPVSATILRGEDVAEFSYSYECETFSVDVDAVFSSPRSKARVGKNNDASAFFGHDNYFFQEVHTNRYTGDSLIVTADGLLHEIKATRVAGSLFEFTMVSVGKVLNVATERGDVLYRESGQVRTTLLFDTLGDATPGGVLVELLSETVHGFFGDGFDLCGALASSE